MKQFQAFHQVKQTAISFIHLPAHHPVGPVDIIPIEIIVPSNLKSIGNQGGWLYSHACKPGNLFKAPV